MLGIIVPRVHSVGPHFSGKSELFTTKGGDSLVGGKRIIKLSVLTSKEKKN